MPEKSLFAPLVDPILLSILFVLTVILLVFLVMHQRSKREFKREKDILYLMKKWQQEHWSLTSLGKPNDREILQHAPEDEGIVVIGKCGHGSIQFNPVFGKFGRRIQAFSSNGIDIPICS